MNTTPFNKRPLFSILHTSARPNKWKEIYDAWIGAAAHPETVEYVLCVDERWGFVSETFKEYAECRGFRDQDRIVWNSGRKCYVDGVNTAAAASSGLILIVNADDQYPCANWDEELTKILPPSPDFVVRVSTDTPTEVERHLMVMPIMSRPRYDRQGYVFYPAYESMYADQDFCEAAEADGVVVEARHLMFPHKHWINNQREGDDVDRAQNRQEAYKLGESVLTERRLNRFGKGKTRRTVTEMPSTAPSTFSTPPPTRRETIGVALPGQTFCGSWVVAWTELHAHLRDRFHVEMQLVYASNVHATRWHLYNGFRDMKSRPDWLLWIDDDNIVTPSQVEQLLLDLRANPDADMVAGWTWCATDVLEIKAHTSIGTLGNAPAQIPYAELMAGPDDLKEIGFTGFPVVLMRGSIFDKVGPDSFAPIMGSQYARGFASEDIAFCIRAHAAGVKILVDRRIKVPHLKLREVRPTDLPVVQEQRETA